MTNSSPAILLKRGNQQSQGIRLNNERLPARSIIPNEARNLLLRNMQGNGRFIVASRSSE